ncbi:hypothetical protein MSG28_004463, partial [Choristoneura fumiferana]
MSLCAAWIYVYLKFKFMLGEVSDIEYLTTVSTVDGSIGAEELPEGELLRVLPDVVYIHCGLVRRRRRAQHRHGAGGRAQQRQRRVIGRRHRVEALLPLGDEGQRLARRRQQRRRRRLREAGRKRRRPRAERRAQVRAVESGRRRPVEDGATVVGERRGRHAGTRAGARRVLVSVGLVGELDDDGAGARQRRAAVQLGDGLLGLRARLVAHEADALRYAAVGNHAELAEHHIEALQRHVGRQVADVQ